MFLYFSFFSFMFSPFKFPNKIFVQFLFIPITIDKCEMYTLKEIEEKNYHFPVYESGMSFYDFLKLDDVVIKKRDLLRFDELKTMRIVYRP